MKISMLPIDSRPCTYNFPQQLVKLLGYDLNVPSIDQMDFFKQPSSYEAISTWLLDAASKSDILILSVDQLLYGGLIASRQNYVSMDEAKQRLDLIKQLKQTKPNLQIYAYNILMRTTVSTVNAESKKWWEKVAKYSKMHYLEQTQSQPKYQQAVKELEREIPRDVLEEFWEVRSRNHTMNKMCLEFAKDNIFERLLILQEDCATQGIQKFEQQVLQEFVNKNNLQNRIYIHNGTDEAGMEICMLALCTLKQSKSIKIHWLGDNMTFTARYEDREFSKNLYSHMQMMNIREEKSAQDVLFIYPPKASQGDHCPKLEASHQYDDSQMQGFAERILAEHKRGKNCFLLDLGYANGGDMEFMKVVSATLDVRQLFGYAAWNTASNALGTILSQIVACRSSNTMLNQKFTMERILDDLVYQAIVREKVEQNLRQHKQDVWCIENLPLGNALLHQSFESKQGVLNQIFNHSVPSFNYKIWWPRTFEIDIEVE